MQTLIDYTEGFAAADETFIVQHGDVERVQVLGAQRVGPDIRFAYLVISEVVNDDA